PFRTSLHTFAFAVLHRSRVAVGEALSRLPYRKASALTTRPPFTFRQLDVVSTLIDARSRCYVLEDDILCAAPEAGFADFAQMLAAFDDAQKVIAGERPELAREGTRAVGEDDLGLAVAARIEQHVARRRMGRSVLETEIHAFVAQRHPATLAAPAHVDELRLPRQAREKGRHRPG